MLLQIVTIGDERLAQKSTEVAAVDDDIRSLIKNMFDTMYAANGIGLAGVQVGVMKRLFVIDVPGKIGSTKLAMINPVMKEMSAEKELGVSNEELTFREKHGDHRREPIVVTDVPEDFKIKEEEVKA